MLREQWTNAEEMARDSVSVQEEEFTGAGKMNEKRKFSEANALKESRQKKATEAKETVNILNSGQLKSSSIKSKKEKQPKFEERVGRDREDEETLLAWNGKEIGFVAALKQAEEERDNALRECVRTERHYEKQGVSEANAAKLAANTAR
nr:WEB family protein At5g16730, chloroplastic-like isoform X2 [Ipomoea batatas]